MRPLIVGFVLLIHAQAPQAPQPSTNGFIAGQIVDANGAPVRSAVVSLSGGLAQISLTVAMARELEGGRRKALTDAQGRFVFGDLAAGSYTLDATKAGYLPGAYGRRRHGGGAQSLTLAEGERRLDVRIPMWEFAAITGMVSDEAGEPMVGVQVTAQRQGFIGTRPRLAAPAETAITDDRGVYRLDGLPPGNYVVCVPASMTSLPSAAADLYQQSRASGSVVSDLPRQMMYADLRTTASLGAGQQFGQVLLGTGARAPSLPPVTDGRQAVYTTRCYPDSNPAVAERLMLDSGAERANVNIEMRPVPAVSVSGVVQAADGAVANVGVRLLPDYVDSLAADSGAETAAALTDATGAFHLPVVPLGQYTLKVLRAPLDPGPNNQSGAPAASTQATGWAQMPLSVGEAGIKDLDVLLSGGVRVTGRLELDGPNPPGPDLIQKFSVQFDPVDGSGNRMAPAFRGRIDRDGRISTNEIPPGRYVVLFLAFAQDRLAMPGWEAVGSTIDGKDSSYTPFELTRDHNTLVMTLSSRASQIVGTVRDARGNGDPGGAILMFPTNRDLWRDRGFSTRTMRLMRAGPSGEYRLGSVPAGEYFIAALPDEDAGDWENPEVLMAASRSATRVTIAKGERKTLDLVTTPLRGVRR